MSRRHEVRRYTRARCGVRLLTSPFTIPKRYGQGGKAGERERNGCQILPTSVVWFREPTVRATVPGKMGESGIAERGGMLSTALFTRAVTLATAW